MSTKRYLLIKSANLRAITAQDLSFCGECKHLRSRSWVCTPFCNLLLRSTYTNYVCNHYERTFAQKIQDNRDDEQQDRQMPDDTISFKGREIHYRKRLEQ